MRIAYVARWPLDEETGILKKMAAQLRTWAGLGHEVRLFAMSPGTTIWEGLRDIPVTAYHGDNLWTRTMWRRRISDPILNWGPELVYLRFSTYYPALERVLGAVPTVIEINGDDLSENRLSLPWLLYLAHRATRSRLLRKGHGMVFVTRELAVARQFAGCGAEDFVLGNGIALADIPRFTVPENERLRLVFVGYAGCAWHGLDKLVELARLCPEYHIDVVGSEAISGNGEIPANLCLHGHLEFRDYEPIVARADVAIATLALHRKQLNEASPLKTREYLACGLPTIIGYEDTDFPKGHPLILQLPNTPDNVVSNIDRIRDFVEMARGKRVDRASIAHLDVMVKERARLDFFTRILENGGNGGH